MPNLRLPTRPDLQHLKREAKALQRAVHAGDAKAIAELRRLHPRLADATAGSPATTRLSLADAQLVVARRYGVASWPRLRRQAGIIVRPVASTAELARVFEAVGARTAPTVSQDSRFLDLARRFDADQPLMVVAEAAGELVGAAFAFRRSQAPGAGVTLRKVVALRPADGADLRHRLVQAIEDAAVALDAGAINLAGVAGVERDLYLSLGYHGRHDGGLLSKALPPRRRRLALNPSRLP